MKFTAIQLILREIKFISPEKKKYYWLSHLWVFFYHCYLNKKSIKKIYSITSIKHTLNNTSGPGPERWVELAIIIFVLHKIITWYKLFLCKIQKNKVQTVMTLINNHICLNLSHAFSAFPTAGDLCS